LDITWKEENSIAEIKHEKETKIIITQKSYFDKTNTWITADYMNKANNGKRVSLNRKQMTSVEVYCTGKAHRCVVLLLIK